MKTDKLGGQTLIYTNTKAVLGELMLENGRRWTSPLRLVASLADEKNYELILEVTPQGTDAHYSSPNLAHVAQISAQHVHMQISAQHVHMITRALQRCQEIRKQTVVDYMKTQGVHEVDSLTFCVTLRMGSLYDIMCTETYIHIYTCIHMYTCKYIYINIHIHNIIRHK